jgi:hypothetical protein
VVCTAQGLLVSAVRCQASIARQLSSEATLLMCDDAALDSAASAELNCTCASMLLSVACIS